MKKKDIKYIRETKQHIAALKESLTKEPRKGMTPRVLKAAIHQTKLMIKELEDSLK